MGRNGFDRFNDIDDYRNRDLGCHEKFCRNEVDSKQNFRDCDEDFHEDLQRDCRNEKFCENTANARERFDTEKFCENFHEHEVDYHKDFQKDCYDQGYCSDNVNFREEADKDNAGRNFRRKDADCRDEFHRNDCDHCEDYRANRAQARDGCCDGCGRRNCC